MLFANIVVTFVAHLVQEEAIKNRLFSQKCLQAIVFASKPFPIGGKRHHTNQSQDDMAKHVIRLLRNRGSCGRDGGKRVTASVTVIETAIEIASFES